MDWDRNLFSKIMIGFGFVMVAVFLGMGITLIYFPIFNIPNKNMRLVFGFFFIAYGLFRMARLYQQIRERKRKEYNDE
jgi:prolipoprotein diacylglyceryltransferase